MSTRAKVLLAVVAVFILIVIIAAVSGGGGDSSSSPASSSSDSSSRATTTRPPTVREQIEDCLSSWDGNHSGFEDQVRPGLNDEGSMETHETRFQASDPDNDGQVTIVMVYSAKNAFGARIKTEATGLLNYRTCRVTVINPGY